MTKNQQVIKYLAISFAIFLIITIISVIIKTSFTFLRIIDKKNTNQEQIIDICQFTNQEIDNLEIDIKSSNLIIQEGISFDIKSNKQDLKCFQSNKKLKIEEDNNFLLNTDSLDLIITIPKNYNYEEVEIETGAGKLVIDSLKTKVLDLELGTGETIINNLEAEKGKIKTGIGAFTIKNGYLNDISFDIGIGKAEIDAKLTGYNKFKTGIGAFDLKLKGLEKDYQFEISKGIGKILVGNQEINDNSSFGNSSNIIKIEGGIGIIKVNFQDNGFIG